MILARADRELRALVAELRDDAAVAKHLGVPLRKAAPLLLCSANYYCLS